MVGLLDHSQGAHCAGLVACKLVAGSWQPDAFNIQS